MKIICISDTHEKHNYIETFPEGDVFIHAGDFTMIGEPEWVTSFNYWLGNLPYKHKIVIAGNHDRSFDLEAQGHTKEDARSYGQDKLSNATYLLDSGIEIEGKHFWGSPYTPFFNSDFWKFSYDRATIGKWDKMPDNLDVLITHGPPMYEGDKTLEGVFAGCWDLNRVVLDKKPKHHIFGHIHEGFGTSRSANTVYHNISAVDRLYRLRADPWTVFEL